MQRQDELIPKLPAVCYEGDYTMKTATVAGIVLIALGILSLTYHRFTYTTQRNIVDVGPLHAIRDERHSVPLPPLLGGVLLIGGIVFLVVGYKGR